MVVRNNYNECLTNLACSIRKYFELDYKHNTIDYIDKILYEEKPKNVVTILFDGMGNNILERTLTKDDFLIKHKIKAITSVFPATTVAATTSIITGLNPCETGMLGWNMYFKDIDKTITTFFNFEKGDSSETPLEEAKLFKEKYMKSKSIVEDLNESSKYKGYDLFPFGENPYRDVDEMIDKIIEICSKEEKKYIYAYDDEPDHSMHLFGADCKEARDMIRYRNILIERLSKKLKDTVIFVIADHGHITVDNIHLEDYPAIIECLDKNTSLEPRATNFFIKEGKKEEFKNLFNQYFGEFFNLYDKNDIIESKLFGNGIENPMFRDSIGDYIAIASSNKTLLYGGDEVLKSQHAGYTDDEIYVPLIVIAK